MKKYSFYIIAVVVLLACAAVYVARMPRFGPVPEMTVIAGEAIAPTEQRNNDNPNPKNENSEQPEAATLDWPSFRGQGRVEIETSPAPVEWSNDANLVWRTALPGPGASSPIVAGDSIFLTCFTGYADSVSAPREGKPESRDAGDLKNLRRHLLCISRTSGEIRWTKTVEPGDAEDSYESFLLYHGYASNTPVTDGRYVYVLFGKSGVCKYDFEGNLKWQVEVGAGSNPYLTGSAASLALHRDRLIVNSSDESLSLRVLNSEDGSVVWRTSSDSFEGAFGTPAVTELNGKPEIVINIRKTLVGLDMESGNMNWYVKTKQDNSFVPSVIIRDNICYATGGAGPMQICAVEIGGEGDISEEGLLWAAQKGPYVSTPVLVGEHLYWASQKGIISCVDANDGSTVKRKRLGGQCFASPVRAGEFLYVTNTKGEVFVVEADPDLEVIATNAFDDDSRFSATPAIVNGQIFIRSERYLYAIGED